MRLLLALLLINSALVGCLGSADEEPSSLETQATEPLPEAQAGQEAASPNATTGNTTPSVEPELVPVEHELVWDGRTGTWAVACAGAVVGACAPALIDGGDRSRNESFEGALETITVTVSWEAETLMMEELGVTLRVVGPDGEPEWATDRGPSPLELELTAPAEAKPWFHVTVGPVGLGTPATFHVVSIDQPFHVDGMYAVLEEVEP